MSDKDSILRDLRTRLKRCRKKLDERGVAVERLDKLVSQFQREIANVRRKLSETRSENARLRRELSESRSRHSQE